MTDMQKRRRDELASEIANKVVLYLIENHCMPEREKTAALKTDIEVLKASGGGSVSPILARTLFAAIIIIGGLLGFGQLYTIDTAIQSQRTVVDTKKDLDSLWQWVVP